MIELLVLGGFIAAGIAIRLLRKKKPKLASDLDIVREALRLLAKGLLEKGEDKAVDFVIHKMSDANINRLGQALGIDMPNVEKDARIRVIRSWLGAQLRRLIVKAKK